MAPDARSAGKRLSLVAINLLVLAFLVSILFLPLEIYYRFIADRSDGLNLSRVSQRWFDRHYHFNNISIRDDIDYAAAIETGKRRLTFLGDSITPGHGVADVRGPVRESGPTGDRRDLGGSGHRHERARNRR